MLLLFVVGCQPNEHIDETDMKKEIKIGVLLYRLDDKFISTVKDAMSDELELIRQHSDYEVVVDYAYGNNQSDLQFAQFENFIEKKYDVMAVNIVNRWDAPKFIDKAREADVPIVFFNREPSKVDMARWERVFYVGAKDDQAGKIQGQIVVDYWKKNPPADKNKNSVMEYIMLEGQQGHQDAILRSEGSIRYITENHIEVRELIKDTANWQRVEAKEKMLKYLRIFGDKVEMIIANNDMMALGAVDAMKELGYAETEYIPVVGVDAISEAVVALEQGKLIGTVLNNSQKQGQIIMDMAYYLAIGKQPVEEIKGIENGKYYRLDYEKITESTDLSIGQ